MHIKIKQLSLLTIKQQLTMPKKINERELSLNLFENNNYIDWSLIAEDYNLKHGDISPEQLITLEKIFTDFIKQNSY